MRPHFRVTPTSRRAISTFQGAWPEDQQRSLLADLLDEPVTLVGPDLLEMLKLALQDLEPLACGMKLLHHLFGDEMTVGMRDDITRDMFEGEPWAHHSHIQWHRGIYEAAWLAHGAHGGAFTKPRVSRVTYDVQALDDDARACLAGPLTAALAARLAAPCTPRGILMRLFDDALAADAFPEAPHVVWFAAWSAHEGQTATLTIEGSDHWWGSVEPGDAADVTAWPDPPPPADD